MENDRLERMRGTLRSRLEAEVQEAFALRDQDGPEATPREMEYFYDLFTGWRNPAALAPDKPLIATTCLQVPLELIMACGAAPLRLCNGSRALEQAGSEFLPAKTCSLVKSGLGLITLFEEELRDRVALVVIPATCDQKRKSIEMIPEKTFKVYPLELPASRDSEEAETYWRSSVKKLIPALERATGRRITGRRLRAAVSNLQQASAQFRRLSRLQQHDPPLLRGRDMFLVLNTFLMGDMVRWTEALNRLNLELEQRKGVFDGESRPRILLTGSPPLAPGLKLPLLLEEAGAAVVADEVCSCSRLLHDTPVQGESRLYDLIPAVADRYLKPCTCPIFNSGEDRRRKIKEMAGRFKVEGVVYQSYSGCQLYQMEQRGVGRVLEEADISFLSVETDFSPEDRGQLITRLEAFVESIRSRKRRNI